MLELGDILEYIEESRSVPLGQADNCFVKTYWIVIEISNSGSCTLFSLDNGGIIQEFITYAEDSTIYRKL